jgi:hypothetical protein
MEDVAAIWDNTDDIREYTDRDLAYSRSWSFQIHDAEQVIRPYIVAAHNTDFCSDLDSLSATMDRALRVQIAKVIDSGDTRVRRDDYDIKWMIPQRGWVRRHTFETVEIPELTDDQKAVMTQMSAPPTCNDIIEVFQDEGLYENKRDVVFDGLKTITGHS